MQSRARRLSTGLTIAIATGAATVFAAPAADAAPNPLLATCGSTVTGAPGTPVQLSTAGALADAVNGAVADQFSPGSAGYDRVMSVLEEFQRDSGTIGIGTIRTVRTPLGTDAVGRYLIDEIQSLSSYRKLESSTANQLVGAVQRQVTSGPSCSVTMSVKAPAVSKPAPKRADKPAGHGADGGRDRELSHRDRELIGRDRELAGHPAGTTAQRNQTPQAVMDVAAITPIMRAGRPGMDTPSFTDAAGGLFHPPGTDDPAFTRTGDAIPLAAGPGGTSDDLGVALIFAVLALSGVGAAVVRTWAVRRMRTYED